MNVDLLTEDFADDAPINKRRALQKIQIVQWQCERLQNLLNDFLKFARVRKLDLSPGNLNEQVNRVLDLFDAQSREMGVDVVRYLDPDLPSIMLDEQTIEAALVNLVKNSLEAMVGGGQLTARTRLTRDGVALDLIDTGGGMDETTAMHMFDAFYSTKDGGSGLGLPTAKKVIEAHGRESSSKRNLVAEPNLRWNFRCLLAWQASQVTRPPRLPRHRGSSPSGMAS